MHRKPHASLALSLLLGLAACDSLGGTSDRTAGGAQGAADGTAGTGQSDLCLMTAQRASAAVRAAVLAADPSCSSVDDCVEISEDTDCHATCGSLVATSARPSVQAAIEEQNETTCADFAAAGCSLVLPPCLPPPPFDCVDGRCQPVQSGASVLPNADDTQSGPEDAGAAQAAAEDAGGTGHDAGTGDTPDASASDACLTHTLDFGLNGGFVAYVDRYTLSPCASFALLRTEFGVAGSGGSCASTLAPDAPIGIAEVNAALAHADVQAGIAAAPVFYGVDMRASDGAIYQIDIDGARIELGAPCAASAGCKAVPDGLSALRTLLIDLVSQQLAAPGCEAFP